MLGSQSDVRVRPARLADTVLLPEVFAEAWRGAYSGLIPHAQLDAIIRRRDRAWWTASIQSGKGPLVITHENRIIGYATCGVARGRGLHQGEIYELYISPTYQGLGFGEHLFEASRARLDAKGLRGLVVWALADNEAAQNFYWRRGGRPFKELKEPFGSSYLAKIGFGWA